MPALRKPPPPPPLPPLPPPPAADVILDVDARDGTLHFVLHNIGFMRVQLPRIERDVVRYRDGASRDGAVRLLPGLTRYGECTLERAVVPADNQFFQWMQAGQVGNFERRDVRVSLLDAQFQPVAVWRLRNCFPVALDWSVLDARSSEVLIESLRLAVEGVEVENTN